MKTAPYKILFVCIHNSARSQMAEAFLNLLGAKLFDAESAGIESGTLNANVVAVMAEIGIDISHKQTKTVMSILEQEKQFDAVITVCDAASAERCPVFPGSTKRIAWTFPDPSALAGQKELVMEQTRQVRDAIRKQVEDFIRQAGQSDYWN